MAKAKQQVKVKPPQRSSLDRDAKGRLITIGCVVCDDGPTFGRVVFIREGAVVYRPFSEDGEPFIKQPLHTAYHDELDVVNEGTPDVAWFGPCATKCLETAELLERVLENVRAVGELAGMDDPFDNIEKVDSAVQDMHAAMFIAAANASTCADYNNGHGATNRTAGKAGRA